MSACPVEVDPLATTQPAPCRCGRGPDAEHVDCDWLYGETTFGPTAADLAEHERDEARFRRERREERLAHDRLVEIEDQDSEEDCCDE